MENIYKKLIASKGVTLVELLVAVAAFGIFIGAISGLLISGIQAQSRVLATQELLNQASYALEYMGRAIRMTVKDESGVCLGTSNLNYLANSELALLEPDVVSGVRFLKSTPNGNICQEFYWYLDPISGIYSLFERRSSDDTSTNLSNAFSLISGSIQVSSFAVNISGNDPAESPNLQPMVTIFLDLLGKATSAGQPKVRVQTSISQRSLDILY